MIVVLVSDLAVILQIYDHHANTRREIDHILLLSFDALVSNLPLNVTPYNMYLNKYTVLSILVIRGGPLEL